MAHRRLTIMLVPHNHKRVREINISHRAVWIAVSCLVVGIVASMGYAVGFHLRSGPLEQLTHVRRENHQLASRISDISRGMVILKNDMGDLGRRNEMLRVVANLPQASSETALMGIGGLYSDQIQGQGMLSQAAKLGMDVHADLEQLLRQAAFQQQNLETIENSFRDDIEFRDHLPSIWPVPPSQVYISSSFGTRADPYTGRRRMHKGLDLAGRTGVPIMTTANGVVKRVVRGRYIGLVVHVDHQNGYETIYGHLSKAVVRAGQKVARGQIIAEMGNTGRSTAPHLHYGVLRNGRAVDPQDFFSATSRYEGT
jgi:murein DD-endopeptidase MepM/ murein hydrolase activator NlpD